LEDRSFEASTSTSSVSSSSISENSCHQVHPVRTTDEKDPISWHKSSEDQPSYSHFTTNNIYNEKKQFYPSFIHNMDNNNYLSTNLQPRVIKNIKEESEYIRIKTFIYHLSFSKIICLFKYIEKYA